MEAPITNRELRDAYQRSGLWRIGMSYERAINVAPIRTSLSCAVRSRRMKAAKADKAIPAQLFLI